MKTKSHPRCLISVIAALLIAPWVDAGPKIGVLLKARSGFWDSAAEGARKAAAELEAELVVKSPQSETDISAQIQMLNTMVEQGCSAIVLAPSSRDALIEPVTAAQSKGVKIVLIDTRLAREVTPVFVGTDQVEAGRAAGNLLAGLVADGDMVCLLRHNQTSGATEQREQGALEALRTARPSLVVHGTIYASSERGVETERANLLIDKYPGVKAILASGTPGTMAMLHVLKDRGLDGKVRFVGFGYNINDNVLAALDSGAMDAWIAQIPSAMGDAAVRTAVAWVQGDPIVTLNYIRFAVVTRSNARDPDLLEALGR